MHSKFFILLMFFAFASCRKAVSVPVGSSTSIPEMVESVKGAVVNIDALSVGRRGKTGMAAGSGFIIDSEGHVLTNFHVVSQAKAVRVRLVDRQTLEAEVIGVDPLADVALLQVKSKTKDLPYVTLADSNSLRVGENVVAIGNPYGLASSVSAGIVSALAREEVFGPYDDFLQTDAPINPGNSGGPLFNLHGEVVGMNTAIVQGSSGVGFAVPSNVLKTLLPQLRQKGMVARGWLGLNLDEVSEDLAIGLGLEGKTGALVTELTPRGPAEKGGLKVDDVVTRIGGRVVESPGMMSRALAFSRPDSELALEVYRDGQPMNVKVKVGKRPDFERFGERDFFQERDSAPSAGKRSIGLSLVSSRGSKSGAKVTEVRPNSPADMAKIVPGDTILEINQHPVYTSQEVVRELKDSPPDSVCVVRIRHASGDETLRAIRIPSAENSRPGT